MNARPVFSLRVSLPAKIAGGQIGVLSFAAAGTTKPERRGAMVGPFLEAKQWTVNKWGSEAAFVGKNCATTTSPAGRNLTNSNRQALAQVHGLKAEDSVPPFEAAGSAIA